MELERDEEYKQTKVTTTGYIIGLHRAAGAFTLVLDGQEMPERDLKGPNDLRNVLRDPKATQK